jgi:hypothetical protein
MPDRTLRKAYKSWTEAVANMKAALAANPLVNDPLMASAQVFEDLGRMMFAGAARLKKRSRKRAKAKSPSARKSKPAPARRMKKTTSRTGRRAPSRGKS